MRADITPENILRTIDALRKPDAAFAHVQNTARQSAADIIEGLVLLQAAKVGNPARGLTLENVAMWMRERLDNAQRIAATKNGADRKGWLHDAEYFAAAINFLAQPTPAALQAQEGKP